MAVHGFSQHVADNRRRSILFVGLYCLTFIPIALLLLGIVPVLLGDATHSIFVDPFHYGPTFLRLAIVLALFLLARSYFGFRREVAEALDIREVSSQDEPRLARIGEEQAILQGLANPRYGIIESEARNAISIGATSGQRTIAVTRGLLYALDDDEIGAMIAHELAHFRAGDAAFLSLNHALTRTAAVLQTYNPLKIDKDVHQTIQWHMVIAIFLPIMLVAFGLGGIVTMYAAQLARRADRSVRASRDFIADAEALRITHFPEALESAITKCEGRGYFAGAERYEALLFVGNPTQQGGTHPTASMRLAELRTVAHEVYMPGRQRRDTRPGHPAAVFVRTPRPTFGRRGATPALALANVGPASFSEAGRRSADIPRAPGLWQFHAYLFDRKAYRAWQRGMFDQLKWRWDDNRNFLGATPEMTVWFVACLLAGVAFYASLSSSPADFLDRFSGRAFFAMSDVVAESLLCDATDPACQEGGSFSSTSSASTPSD